MQSAREAKRLFRDREQQGRSDSQRYKQGLLGKTSGLRQQSGPGEARATSLQGEMSQQQMGRTKQTLPWEG
jgi:hypothetical protein